MSKVLVQWSDNWADEMDIEGFVIMESSEWKEFKEQLKEINKPFSICIGTNEDIEYPTGQDLLDTLSTKKLTNEEYKIINKHFGDCFGFSQFENAIENASIYEEADEMELDEEGYYETDEDDEDF